MGQIIKVNGADVQVFEYESAEAMEGDASKVAPDGGIGLIHMLNYYDTYNKAFKVKDADIDAVLTFYGTTTFHALNDAVWAKYRLGEFLDATAPATGQPAITNPWRTAPVILGKGIIRSERGENVVDIKGIDVDREKTVTQLAQSIRSGSLDALKRVYGIGDGMAKRIEPYVTFSTPSRPIGADLATACASSTKGAAPRRKGRS